MSCSLFLRIIRCFFVCFSHRFFVWLCLVCGFGVGACLGICCILIFSCGSCFCCCACYTWLASAALSSKCSSSYDYVAVYDCSAVSVSALVAHCYAALNTRLYISPLLLLLHLLLLLRLLFPLLLILLLLLLHLLLLLCFLLLLLLLRHLMFLHPIFRFPSRSASSSSSCQRLSNNHRHHDHNHHLLVFSLRIRIHVLTQQRLFPTRLAVLCSGVLCFMCWYHHPQCHNHIMWCMHCMLFSPDAFVYVVSYVMSYEIRLWSRHAFVIEWLSFCCVRVWCCKLFFDLLYHILLFMCVCLSVFSSVDTSVSAKEVCAYYELSALCS